MIFHVSIKKGQGKILYQFYTAKIGDKQKTVSPKRETV